MDICKWLIFAIYQGPLDPVGLPQKIHSHRKTRFLISVETRVTSSSHLATGLFNRMTVVGLVAVRRPPVRLSNALLGSKGIMEGLCRLHHRQRRFRYREIKDMGTNLLKEVAM